MEYSHASSSQITSPTNLFTRFVNLLLQPLDFGPEFNFDDHSSIYEGF